MGTIGGTITETSQQVLEGLDFPVPCAHSQHGIQGPDKHSGNAEHIVTFMPPCGHSVTYPACDAFVRYIPSGFHWRCGTCPLIWDAEDVEWDIHPLNEAT